MNGKYYMIIWRCCLRVNSITGMKDPHHKNEFIFLQLLYWAHYTLHGSLICIAFCPSVWIWPKVRLDNNSCIEKYYKLIFTAVKLSWFTVMHTTEANLKVGSLPTSSCILHISVSRSKLVLNLQILSRPTLSESRPYIVRAWCCVIMRRKWLEIL